MRSWRFLLSRRWLAFAVIVALLCYGAWWLGEWQFGRLADRKAHNAVVRANEDKDPADVADVLAPDRAVDDDDEWRRVQATGTYDTANTVIVRYRTRDGSSGIDVVVPLVTSHGTALLVDRGWMSTDNQGTSPDDVPTPPDGEVTVDGWVRANATGDSTTVEDHSTRAISSTEIEPAIDRPVYGGFIELEAEDGAPADGLEPVELPELDNGPHFFYGLQWWFFGILALFGFGYLAYDERRGQRRGADPQRAEVVAERKRRRAEKDLKKRAVKEAYQRAYAAEKAQRARSMPPSTGSMAPETNDEAGDSTNAATRPNSSGTP